MTLAEYVLDLVYLKDLVIITGNVEDACGVCGGTWY